MVQGKKLCFLLTSFINLWFSPRSLKNAKGFPLKNESLNTMVMVFYSYKKIFIVSELDLFLGVSYIHDHFLTSILGQRLATRDPSLTIVQKMKR